MNLHLHICRLQNLNDKKGEAFFSKSFFRKVCLEFDVSGAVQQFKIGRKIKVYMALNPKRSNFFSAKSNYGTAS